MFFLQSINIYIQDEISQGIHACDLSLAESGHYILAGCFSVFDSFSVTLACGVIFQHVSITRI